MSGARALGAQVSAAPTARARGRRRAGRAAGAAAAPCCGRSATSPPRTPTRAARGSRPASGLDSAGVRAAHGRAPARRRHRRTTRVLAAFAARAAPPLRRRRAGRPRPTRTPACRSGTARRSPSPSVVARMLELLFGGANARASGQPRPRARDRHRLRLPGGAAGAAGAAGDLDRAPEAAARQGARAARGRCARPNLRLVFGDGMLGHAPGAPYDSIIAAAGGDAVPQAWLDQLAVGGRLVAPVAQAGGRAGARRRRSAAEAAIDRTVHEAVQLRPSKIRACALIEGPIRLLMTRDRGLDPAGVMRARPSSPRRSSLVACATPPHTVLRSRTASPHAARDRRRRRTPRRAPARRAPVDAGQACRAPRTPASPATTSSSRATR